jgi:hypothetical protein
MRRMGLRSRVGSSIVRDVERARVGPEQTAEQGLEARSPRAFVAEHSFAKVSWHDA